MQKEYVRKNEKTHLKKVPKENVRCIRENKRRRGLSKEGKKRRDSQKLKSCRSGKKNQDREGR